MAITISGSGITSANIADGTIVNADINSSAAIDGSKLTGVGKVLQVVSTTKTSIFTTTSSSYVDVTGASATITPSATTSKILVTITGAGSGGGTSNYGYGIVLRDTTQILLGDTRGPSQRCSFALTQSYSNTQVMAYTVGINGLDSPATTSALTYKIQIKATLGTVSIGGSTDVADGNRASIPTTITLTEIGA